jgi:FHA domain/Protein of unknown function (DUF3662)
MPRSAVVLSSAPTRIGSFLTALLFICWICLVGIALARILTGAPRSSRTWTWPPLSRRLSPKHLEHHVLRTVARSAVLDPRGTSLLPNHVEILLRPSELRALGPLADQVAENIAHGMVTLTRKRGYRLPADPHVILAATPDNLSSRPIIHTDFGRPATTMHATESTKPLSASPPDEAAAVLRRLQPPGRPLLLGSRHVRLGRRPECDLVVPDPGVSRRHASLYRRVAGWYLVDHGSTNGTFINGERIKTPAKLASGDEIQLGKRVRLRFEHSHLRST